MTAITIADRSTQSWEDTALGPNNFESPTTLSEDQKKERRLYEVTPELEHFAQAEWSTVERWLSFKMAPHFVGQIYKGEPLTIEPDEAASQYIIPESKALQGRYLRESLHIVKTQIPTIEDKIADYEIRASNLETSVTQSERRIENGDASPKLKIDTDSWRRQAKTMRKTASNLTADIPNLQMGAHVKDALFYKINDFVTRTREGENADMLEAIVHESKIIALEQVIIEYKSERARAASATDPDEDEDPIIVRGYDKKIEVLENELHALQDVSVEDAQDIQTQVIETQEQAQEQVQVHESKLLAFRRRILGSFSSKAAALYGAFTH